MDCVYITEKNEHSLKTHSKTHILPICVSAVLAMGGGSAVINLQPL